MEEKIKKIEIDVKLLPRKFIEKFDLCEENFEIENIFNLDEEIIKQCLYNFNENKQNFLKSDQIDKIMQFLFHYQLDDEFDEIFKCFLKEEKELKLNNNLESKFQYNLQLKSINDPRIACEKGFLYCLKLSIAKGLLKAEDKNIEFVNLAAKNGQFEIFKFLIELGFYWKHETIDCAAENGQLEMLKYLITLGGQFNEDTINFAAENGQFEIVKFLIEEKKCKFSKKTMICAAKKDNLHIVKYLINKGCEIEPWISTYAASNGNLDCLKYYLDFKCLSNEFVAEFAARNGHLHILMFLKEMGFPINFRAIKAAAICGHIECLKYLYGIEIDLKDISLASIAKKGHLDCLKFLIEKGCQIDEDVGNMAAENGHLDILKYLIEKKFLINIDMAINIAAINGFLNCVKYLHQIGACLDIYSLNFAAKYGKFEVLQYITDSLNIFSQNALILAKENGNLECIKFLQEKEKEIKIIVK